MTTVRKPTAPLVTAVSLALAGGCVVGFLEGLVVLQANAFAQPDQYAWLYLSVPILSWVGLAIVLLVPLAIVLQLVGRPPSGTLLAGVFALVAAGGLLSPLGQDIEARLVEVGATSSLLLRVAVWTGLLAICLLLAVTASAAAARLDARLPRALHQLAAGAALLSGLREPWGEVEIAFGCDGHLIRELDQRLRRRPAVAAVAEGARASGGIRTHSLRAHLRRRTDRRRLARAPGTLTAIIAHPGAGAIPSRQRGILARSGRPRCCSPLIAREV